MSNDDEIYTFKLYNSTKVHPENDLDPTGKENSKICCTDQHLYLCCNSADSPESSAALHRPSVEVWRFNFLKNKWSTVHRLSDETPRVRSCCHHARRRDDDLLYFRTCVFPEPSRHTNQSLYFSNIRRCGDTMDFVDVIPERTGAVENSPDNAVCPPQYEGYATAINDADLYVVGGVKESGPSVSLSMDIYVFRLTTDERTKLYDYHLVEDPPAPAGVWHRMVYYEHGLYIFGGSNLIDIFSLENLPVFDLKTNSWKVLETVGDPDMAERFPGPREFSAIAQDPHQPSVVFMNGGFAGSAADAPRCFEDTWRLDLSTLRWKCTPSRYAIRGMCAHLMDTTPDGRMYIFAGASNMRKRDESLLSVAWINVPKLADMCWDAFLFYVRKGVLVLPADLRTLGIPIKYLGT